MSRPSVIHAWDGFWDRTGYIGLHHLGTHLAETDTGKAWTDAVTELQGVGPFTIAQIEAITELVECTVRLVRA